MVTLVMVVFVRGGLMIMYEFWRDMKQRRFKKLYNGYKMDRWFFQVAMWMTFVWLFTVAYSLNFNIDYFSCGSTETLSFSMTDWCDNPFYEPASWKNERMLPPGEYGVRPGLLFYSTQFVPIVLFLVAGVLNHLIHNRRREK